MKTIINNFWVTETLEGSRRGRIGQICQQPQYFDEHARRVRVPIHRGKRKEIS